MSRVTGVSRSQANCRSNERCQLGFRKSERSSSSLASLLLITGLGSKLIFEKITSCRSERLLDRVHSLDLDFISDGEWECGSSGDPHQGQDEPTSSQASENRCFPGTNSRYRSIILEIHLISEKGFVCSVGRILTYDSDSETRAWRCLFVTRTVFL